MKTAKHSGEVNLDNTAIDEKQDGTYLYFHDLPPVLLRNPIVISPQDHIDEDSPP